MTDIAVADTAAVADIAAEVRMALHNQAFLQALEVQVVPVIQAFLVRLVYLHIQLVQVVQVVHLDQAFHRIPLLRVYLQIVLIQINYFQLFI